MNIPNWNEKDSKGYDYHYNKIKDKFSDFEISELKPNVKSSNGNIDVSDYLPSYTKEYVGGGS